MIHHWLSLPASHELLYWWTCSQQLYPIENRNFHSYKAYSSVCQTGITNYVEHHFPATFNFTWLFSQTILHHFLYRISHKSFSNTMWNFKCGIYHFSEVHYWKKPCEPTSPKASVYLGEHCDSEKWFSQVTQATEIDSSSGLKSHGLNPGYHYIISSLIEKKGNTDEACNICQLLHSMLHTV